MNHTTLNSLLLAALTLSAAHLAANGVTNKTFLMPRTQGVNLPMHATSFYDVVHRETHTGVGATTALTGFWQQSANGQEQGKYFLADGTSTIDVSPSAASDSNPLPDSSLDLGTMLHVFDRATDVAGSTLVSLDPRQEVYGLRLDYHHSLDRLLSGLYLDAAMPVVTVSNNPRLRVSDDAGHADQLTRFFAGTYSSHAPHNAQAALRTGKIAGKRTESGVADIDVMLGYTFLDKAKYHATCGLAVAMPMGNKATGDWLFEPIVGNGQHWGLGADLSASARLWECDEQSILVSLVMKYRYLFENNQRRVLGLTGGNQVGESNLAQYQLLGQHSPTARNVALIPAANVLAMKCDVTPGSLLDANLGLTYRRGSFSVDLGYNMYFREAESLTVKDSLASGLAIANAAFDTSTAFDVTHNSDVVTDSGGADPILSLNNIDSTAALTPSQFTNALYGGAGYTFKNFDGPVMLGVGAKYEWANNNSALDQWGAWLKLGVGF